MKFQISELGGSKPSNNNNNNNKKLEEKRNTCESVNPLYEGR